MEHRDRTTANSANGLLSRQFASITDVLFKASERRNQELQKLQQRLLRPVPTPSTSKSAHELFVTAKPESSQGSGSGDDCVELEQVEQNNKGTTSDYLTVVASTMGLSGKHTYMHYAITRFSLANLHLEISGIQVQLRGGYVSDCADDSKMMIAELNSPKQKHSGSGVQEELDDNDDLARMLAGLKNHWSSLKGNAVRQRNDPKAISAGLNVYEEGELSALAKRLGIDSNESEVFEDSKAALDILSEQDQTYGTGHSEDENDDLEFLRAKLATMFTPPFGTASGDFPYIAKSKSVVSITPSPQKDVAGMLKPAYISSAVALRLESRDVESEGAKGRFTQPFSNSMDEQEAKDEKAEMVKKENEKLEATIKYVLEEEKRYRKIEENKRLPARLILSNLAADADDKAIRIFFAKYSTEM